MPAKVISAAPDSLITCKIHNPEERLRRLEWIVDTQTKLAELDFDLDGFMQSVVDRLPEIAPADGVVVELVSGDDMVYRATSSHLSHLVGLRLKREGSLTGLCVALGQTLYAADTETDDRVDREACRRVGLRAMVCVPLSAGGRVVGVLKAFSVVPMGFGPDDMEVLDRLGKTIAAALAKQVSFDAYRAQTELFENAFDHAPIGLALVGLDGRFLKVNAAFGGIVDYTVPEMLAATFQDITHAEDLDRDLELLAELTAGSRDRYQMDKRYLRRDGRIVWVSLSVSMHRHPSGEPAFYIAQVQDLTPRKATETALVEARMAAEAAAATKAEFLANMSHELRTPLTAIIGFGGLLADDDALPSGARRHVQRIRTASEALLTTVNDVLDFSKLEAGQVEIRPSPSDLCDVIEAAAGVVAEQARAKGLAFEIVTDLPDPRAEIDESRVRQILLNLLSNAIKFTEQGVVRLEAGHADGRLRCRISDTGPGVPEDKLAKLFQRFSQVDGSSTRRHGGTGLGLAICKGLAEAMDGRIGVESREGEGSTFWFEIPAPLAAGTRTAPSPATVEDDCDLAGLRVLIVDDAAFNRELIAAMLRPLGCEVVTAESGEAALSILSDTGFEVMLLDRHMPGLEGRELAQRIRALGGPNANACLIACSADVLATLEPVFDGALAKPITPAALVAAVALGRVERTTDSLAAA